MDLIEVRTKWNDVLDSLEKNDRIAWMAFFDARLDSLEDATLFLDFSDARKLSGAHEYAPIRQRHLELLESAIKDVLGVELSVREKE